MQRRWFRPKPFLLLGFQIDLLLARVEKGAALELLTLDYKEWRMTRTQWILVGAIALGVAVGVYVLFFCPTDCH